MPSKTKNEPKISAGEKDVLATIEAMPKEDRVISEKLHDLIKESGAELKPKTWYGMPAYAKDGKVVCFFGSTQKMEERYMTLGFSDKANLDDGNMWPTSFAIKKLTSTEEKKIAQLVKKAIS